MALTDPADELARICERIIDRIRERAGDSELAGAVGVQPWGKEFYQLIFCLTDQVDHIERLLVEQNHPEVFLNRVGVHLNEIRRAFTAPVMTRVWDHKDGLRSILEANYSPLGLLSPMVAMTEQYPLLSKDEVADLLADLEQLLTWLKEHQLEEHDLLRAALIDGLTTYQFRLERIEWLGWRHGHNALQQTIGAYLALERGHSSADIAPVQEAALRKVGEYLGKIWRMTGAVSDTADRVGTAIKLYGMAAMIRDGTPLLAAITVKLT